MFARIHLFVLWFAIVSALGSPAYAAKLFHNKGHAAQIGTLPTASTVFDPPFVIADQLTKIMVSLELADPSMRFSHDMLILEQQKLLPNGQTVFIPITELRDGGKHNNGNIRDGIFTGTAEFHKETSGTILIRARGVEKNLHQMLVSSPIALPVQLACGPTATILPIKIFDGHGAKHQSRAIDFDVPVNGKAILRLVNGARIGAPVAERMASAKVSINGKQVETVSKSINATEFPVNLKQGTNRLELQQIIAKSSQRLSARIDACADKLALKPVLDTQQVGRALVAEATLTGLGVPIPNAPISFMLTNLGNFPEQTASSNETGVARVSLPPFTSTGSGRLTASTLTAEPALSDTVAINVATNLSIGVRQSVSSIRIKQGETNNVSFFVDLFKVDNQAYNASFEQLVEPNDGGINLTPNGVQSVTFEAPALGQETKPRVKEIPITVNAIKPGRYAISSRANLKLSGETTSSILDVEVLPAAETLNLSAPSLQPGAVSILMSTPVIFQARVNELTNPPAVLNVQECTPGPAACSDNPNDSRWKPIGNLLDNGQGSDDLAGDGVYSSELLLAGKTEGQLLYRVMVQEGGSAIVSPAAILQVSRFPNEPDSTSTEIIEAPSNDVYWVAENVLVSFIPTTSPGRIEQIVSESTLAVTGREGIVAGQVPEIGLLQIKLFVDPNLSEIDRADLISAVVNRLNSYDEVSYAEPNIAISLAATPDDGGTQQWGAPRIHADRAWNSVTTPQPGQYANGTPLVVAIVDTGVRETHQDLITQYAAGSEFVDQYVESIGGSITAVGHGTGVAAVIAAKHGNGGISGIAHGARIYSVKGVTATGGQVIPQIQGAAGIVRAANNQAVKIINLSWNQLSPIINNGQPAEPLGLKCALRYAVEPTTIGSECNGAWTAFGISQPNSNTHAKLVVSSAGNGTPLSAPVNAEIIPNAINADSRYPCSWDHLVMCVGNSSVNPSSETSTYSEPEIGGTDILHTINDPNPFNTSTCSGATGFPSNKGNAVDIYAPGTCIYTAINTGDTGFSKRTGTSFAAPQVSAAAAVVWAQMGEGTSAQTVRNQLTQCSKPVQVEGKPFLDLFKSASQKAHINLVSGEAGYKNLFGVYNKATNKARIVHNIQTVGSGQVETFNRMETLYLTQSDKDDIGYFIIPNGASLNAIQGTSDLNPYAEPDLTVAPVQQGNITLFCIKNNAGNCLIGQDAYAFFSDQSKNPDGQVHVKTQFVNPLDANQGEKQFWEDLLLPDAQSGDFNDAVIQINFDLGCPIP